MIREKCDNEWKFNFQLFGGDNETQNTKKLYNYFLSEQPPSSNLFTSAQNSSSVLQPNSPFIIYIPGEMRKIFSITSTFAMLILYFFACLSCCKFNRNSVLAH